MGTKAKKVYICQSCGGFQHQWTGQCKACDEWNTLVEEQGRTTAVAGSIVPFTSLNPAAEAHSRFTTRVSEFDRVCGGGLVQGSVVLMGGDPGIGKSTLLLQLAADLSRKHKVAYFSGEEAASQIAMRAKRLAVENHDVHLATSTAAEDVLATCTAARPEIVIIDSIQTLNVDQPQAAMGSIVQLRTATHLLTRYAKENGVAIILVGHVTKEGAIAGPRVLEHMVDVVLYLEGERTHQFRLLRSVKNRYGPTNEIGVFDMTESGMVAVTNPSQLFLSHHQSGLPGSAIFAGMEGTRPILLELQSLLSPTPYAAPKRATVGTDAARLSMILAILETRAEIQIGMRDVYLSVIGGIKMHEPSADIACAASLISSIYGVALNPKTIYLGELGLSGEVRPVPHLPLRLREAKKLGFTDAVVPQANAPKVPANLKMTVTYIQRITDLAELIRV